MEYSHFSFCVPSLCPVMVTHSTNITGSQLFNTADKAKKKHKNPSILVVYVPAGGSRLNK